MFNKREQQDHDSGASGPAQSRSVAGTESGTAARQPAAGRERVAVIGPSISIEGQLNGEEDLIVEGKVKGTIRLKNNTLTIGNHGTLEAEVYAHTIFVDGKVDGDLYASERISIRKGARISGNILAPRISLEDGARFQGSIDMDAESEAFRKAFGQPAGAGSKSSDSGGKPSTGSDDRARPEPTPAATTSKAADREGKPGSPGTAQPSGGPGKAAAGQPGKAGGSAA